MSQVLHLSSRYCEVMLVKNIRVMTGSYWTLLQVKKLVDLKLTGIKFDLKLTLEFDVSIYAWMGQKKKMVCSLCQVKLTEHVLLHLLGGTFAINLQLSAEQRSNANWIKNA